MGWLHAGWQKNYSHAHKRKGSVAKCCLQRGTLLPHSCEARSKYCLTASRVLDNGTTVVWLNSVIYPFKKASKPRSTSYGIQSLR